LIWPPNTGSSSQWLRRQPPKLKDNVQIIKVLIADDHKTVHQQVKSLFSAAKNIQVVSDAKTGEEVLQLARELRPDVVLMDIRMPGMNGIETARLLKAEMPKLKIIFLTNYDLDLYREAASASGASGYILKETMFKTLLPAIQAAIRAGNQSQSQEKK
jgi:DNA-binding NarL/FixJ family response regulator